MTSYLDAAAADPVLVRDRTESGRYPRQMPSGRHLVHLTTVIALLGIVTGCADGDARGEARAQGTASTTTRLAGALDRQFGVRYCELLALTVGKDETTAEVWGTQGLNDCPQATFEAIDSAAVGKELGVTAAVKNGPRYWVLDAIVANQLAGSGERRNLGGMEMRSIAIVDLGAGIPSRAPYTETSVRRDTEFRFDAGRRVYELTGPDGSVYEMQSYSVETDPTLSVDALAALGGRLRLPEGWTFSTRILDQPLVVEDVEGVATVIQDELHNSYQLRRRGSG